MHVSLQRHTVGRQRRSGGWQLLRGMKFSSLARLMGLLACLLLTGCIDALAPDVRRVTQGWEYQPGFRPEMLSPGSTGWQPTPVTRTFEVPKDLPSWPAYVTLRHQVPDEVLRWASVHQVITLRSGRASDVSMLYLNDKMLARRGQIAPYVSGLYRHYLVDIPSDDLLAVSHPYLYLVIYSDGTLPLKFEGQSTVLGVTHDVYAHHYFWELYLFSLLAIYLVVGLYHLVLFFYRIADRRNLFFALFCPTVSYYFFFRSFSRELIFGDHTLFRLKSEYCSLVLSSLFFLWFCYYLFRPQKHSLSHQQVPTTPRELSHASFEKRLEAWDKLAATVITGVSSLLLILIFVGGYPTMRLALFCWQGIAFITLSYILYRLIFKLLKGETWSRPMLIGVAIFFAGTFKDMLAVHGLAPIDLGAASTAFLAFVLSIAVALARQFRDIYREVDELSVHLDQKVRARTLELEQAKEEAEESSRIKSSFLAHLSHEIRTPLHGMLGLTELLLQSRPTVEQKNLLELLYSSGKNFLQLLNDVLTTSKLEAGRLELHPEPFRFRHSIEQVCRTFELGMAQSRVRFSVEIDPKLPDVFKGDSGRLQQIIANLLSNAFKFTRVGSVSMTLQELPNTALQEHELQLLVRVRDSGVGVPEHFQSRIFESFAQADSSMSRIYGGTGLGTTIASQLVQMMHGQLGLKSPLRQEDSDGGPGSEFWFTVRMERVPVSQWPAVQERTRMGVTTGSETEEQTRGETGESAAASGSVVDPLDAPLNPAPGDGQPVPTTPRASSPTAANTPATASAPETAGESLAGAASRSERREFPGMVQPSTPTPRISALLSESRPDVPQTGLRVLVAEDNAINQLIMKRFLLGMGHSVEIAVDGQDAVSKAETNAYDMIFMDIQMPHLNGFEATEAIRARVNRDVPIIALTANAFPEDIARGTSAGMNDLLAKPCTREELREVIARWSTGRTTPATKEP